MLSVNSRGCCSCCNSGPQQDQNCRTTITSADLAELAYVAGLDEELCCKFQAIAEITSLIDCEGNPITRDEPLVTCEGFRDFLCETFAAMVDAGVIVLEGASVGTPTLLVGANCNTYTVPETNITVVDTDAINLSVSGEHNHTVTAELIISPDAGNMAVVNPNGLYVPETPIVVVDTSTVDLGSSGTAGHTITASVKISAVPNNCIVAQADGIYSECTDLCDDIGDLPVGAPSVPGVSSFVGTDCQTHVLTETEFTAVDTATIDFTTAGSFGHQLTGSVKISNDPDNIITIDGSGIAVTCDDVAACVVVDPVLVGDTITVDLTKTLNTITADVNVSAIAGNDLIIQADGLYVDVCANLGTFPYNGDVVLGVTQLVSDDCNTYTIPTSIASDAVVLGDDTNCISVTVVEAPTDTFTVTAEPIIDPDPSNVLECRVAGLYVPSGGGDATTILASDTNCINMSAVLTDVNEYTVSAVPVIATNHTGYPIGCNGLQCTALGLSAPPDVAGSAIEVGLATPALYDDPLGPAVDTFVSPIIDLDIDNPSTCRDAVLAVGLRVPESQVIQNAGSGRTKVHFLIEHDVNLPGVLVTGGFVTKTEWVIDIEAPGAGTREWMTPGFDLIPRYLLPAGFAGGNIQWRATITQEVGSSDNVRLNAMVIRGEIITVGA